MRRRAGSVIFSRPIGERAIIAAIETLTKSYHLAAT
jgi:hypothetical protein